MVIRSSSQTDLIIDNSLFLVTNLWKRHKKQIVLGEVYSEGSLAITIRPLQTCYTRTIHNVEAV